MMIDNVINALVRYALDKNLIGKEDRYFCINRLLALVGKNAFDLSCEPAEGTLPELLTAICNEAVRNGIISDTVTDRDLFDTAVMGVFTARPSEIERVFYEKYASSPEKATDYFYTLCNDVNYIRTDRVSKMLKWKYTGEYGTMDITINLSKPEKDPKEIAAAKLAPQTGYPRCMLCAENVGYEGRIDFPARQNHRMIPIDLNGSEWYLQYSPYVYYDEHCIVLENSHRTMKIERSTFEWLLAFLDKFPHYFIGSNADLPIVGGSILNHEHFQGGRYEFAMERAPIEKEIVFAGFENVKAGIVKWPMSTIRLRSADRESVISLAERIREVWSGYEDKDAFILPFTYGDNGETVCHNTVTPIARMKNGEYELDIVLRNNITTEEYPLGVYHPHGELHHIKKENIGLIEVMGLAVLPPRLKNELNALAEAIVNGRDLSADPLTAPHAEWAKSFAGNYSEINENNAEEIIRAEVGKVFAQVLEHAGVFKRDEAGRNAFDRFIKSV